MSFLSTYKSLRLLTIAVIMPVLSACKVPEHEPQEVMVYEGAWIWSSDRFERGELHVSDKGVFIEPAHSPKDAQRIDLSDRYIVPPFCEAHNHNIGGSFLGVEETAQRYLNEGVFYTMMLGSFTLYREGIEKTVNTPSSIDVAFANNGITGSGGHPRGLRESLQRRFGSYPEFTPDTLPDKGYFEADTIAELREKWQLIANENPDLVKAMLFFSEEYDLRKDNPDHYGRRGLNPSLLPEFVRLAHDDGLRVAVHVESDFDMATALRAGADIIAHMPSYDAPIGISPETIELAGSSGAVIITTLTIANRYQQRDPEGYAAIVEAQKANLKLLLDAGVTLAIGSDNVRGTSRGEAAHIAAMDTIDNRALLNMWTTNCAQTVFPNRKIGQLTPGYEASFLVLQANPIEDFQNTSRIELRVKNGQVLATQRTQ